MKYITELNTLGKAYLDLVQRTVAVATQPEKWADTAQANSAELTKLAKSSAELGFTVYADSVREGVAASVKLGVPASILNAANVEQVLSAQQDLVNKFVGK